MKVKQLCWALALFASALGMNGSDLPPVVQNPPPVPPSGLGELVVIVNKPGPPPDQPAVGATAEITITGNGTATSVLQADGVATAYFTVIPVDPKGENPPTISIINITYNKKVYGFRYDIMRGDTNPTFVIDLTD